MRLVPNILLLQSICLMKLSRNKYSDKNIPFPQNID